MAPIIFCDGFSFRHDGAKDGGVGRPNEIMWPFKTRPFTALKSPFNGGDCDWTGVVVRVARRRGPPRSQPTNILNSHHSANRATPLSSTSTERFAQPPRHCDSVVRLHSTEYSVTASLVGAAPSPVEFFFRLMRFCLFFKILSLRLAP